MKNMTPSIEFPRDFCAGIGPLQLSVVLVEFHFSLLEIPTHCVTIGFSDKRKLCLLHG